MHRSMHNGTMMSKSNVYQRVAIARAIILKPEPVVTDELVSMIDVSLRASILDLMLRLKQELNLTYVFITHDLAVAKYIADRIAVMYLGKIVEYGPSELIFENLLHPYTKALLASIPVPRPLKESRRIELKGEVPNPINPLRVADSIRDIRSRKKFAKEMSPS